MTGASSPCSSFFIDLSFSRHSKRPRKPFSSSLVKSRISKTKQKNQNKW